LSGFFYTYFFYGFFGVPISTYFTVSDYVSSSIEQLFSVFFGVFIGLMFVFLGSHRASRRPVAIVEQERKRPDHFVLIVGSSIILLTFSGIVVGGRDLHMALSTDILLIGFLIVPWIATRYFQNYTRATFVLIVFFAFASHMYRTTFDNIYEVLEGKSVPILCKEVLIDRSVDWDIPSCGSVVLGGTSLHVFVFDQDQQKTFAVDRDHVF
ncbi:unnamed protein product, partial [Chrysoparadoxa australica]